MLRSLVGSEMCIRDSLQLAWLHVDPVPVEGGELRRGDAEALRSPVGRLHPVPEVDRLESTLGVGRVRLLESLAARCETGGVDVAAQLGIGAGCCLLYTSPSPRDS